MSRTIRKNKHGDAFRDGKGYIKGFQCKCWLCTGSSKEDLREKKEQVLDQEIKDTVDLYYGDIVWNQDQIWNRFFETESDIPRSLEEEVNWIEYLEAA